MRKNSDPKEPGSDEATRSTLITPTATPRGTTGERDLGVGIQELKKKRSVLAVLRENQKGVNKRGQNQEKNKRAT